MQDIPRLPFPVGFRRFTGRTFLDYQLNRAHALGWIDAERLHDVAPDLRSFEDAVRVFDAASRRWEDDGSPLAAIGAVRIAEFFTPGAAARGTERYLRYRALFDAAFRSRRLERRDVPYEGSTLPAHRLAAAGPERGVVLLHGGFDSLIEEFLGIWQRIAAAGFDVIAFDGPGQGGARRLGGVLHTHDWERPVGAVLDHFGVERATLIGISMGGHWALRAAGREPRIARVVAWPPVYDWLLRAPRPLRPAIRAMVRRRGFMRWSVRVRARLVPTLGFVVDQALTNVGSDDPVDVVDWFLGMNPEHLGSDRVTQDVLILFGEDDAFQPPALAEAQARALTSASSVTLHRFTAAEQASSHCQMGNLERACQVLTDWLVRA